MKTRIIQTRFWDDEFIGNLQPNGKLLFLFLITNDKIGMTGAYEMPDKYISFHTGLNPKEVLNEKNNLKTKMVFIKGWIIVLNAGKYNNYCSNDKQSKAYMKEYDLLPEYIKPYVDTVDAPDYVPKYIKSNGTYKHVEIAESALGRKLTEEEVVHHIDKNPANNNPENLGIMSKEHHIALHQGNLDLSDTSMILVSDLYDTRPKSEIRNKKSEIRKQKKGESEGEILEVKKFSTRDSITSSVIVEIADKYDVPKDFVEDCWDTAQNWLDSKNTRKDNYKAFLSNWVKRSKADYIYKAKKVSGSGFKQRGGFVDVS